MKTHLRGLTCALAATLFAGYVAGFTPVFGQQPPPPGRFTCRASVARIEVHGIGFVEPDETTANRQQDPCVAENPTPVVDLMTQDPTRSATVTAHLVHAQTRQTPTAGASAHSEAAFVAIATSAGTISARLLNSEAHATCPRGGGRPVLGGSSQVGQLNVPGREAPVLPGHNHVNIPGLGTLHVNHDEEAVDANQGLRIQRALWLETTAFDVVIAESIADYHGNPCPPVGTPTQTPTATQTPTTTSPPPTDETTSPPPTDETTSPPPTDQTTTPPPTDQTTPPPTTPATTQPPTTPATTQPPTTPATTQPPTTPATTRPPTTPATTQPPTTPATTRPPTTPATTRPPTTPATTRPPTTPPTTRPPTVSPSPVVPGRMTGGGWVEGADGTRVTHGFELPCNIAVRHSNLQVNWREGRRFHLERLTFARCTDSPGIEEYPPEAGFDTYEGSGTGRMKGREGATARWTFTDAGEPGRDDFLELVVQDARGRTLLVVASPLDGGNHQAHPANPSST